MKLRTLFEAIHPGDGKDIGDKFKALAKKCDLMLKYSNAWPKANSSGVWFGGILRPLGGEDVEHNMSDERLPQEIRERAFWKSLAKELERYIGDGNIVRIATRQNNKAEPVKAGEVLAVLTKTVNTMSAPGSYETGNGVYWFIGDATGRKVKTFVIDIENEGSFHVYCDTDVADVNRWYEVELKDGGFEDGSTEHKSALDAVEKYLKNKYKFSKYNEKSPYHRGPSMDRHMKSTDRSPNPQPYAVYVTKEEMEHVINILKAVA